MTNLKTEKNGFKHEEIKELSVLNTVSLINLEGKGLLGKAGINARIFSIMGQLKISVSIISQGSSERGIGIVVNTDRATEAVEGLKKEFSKELFFGDVSKVFVDHNVAAISISGQDLTTFHKLYSSLIRNKITPILFNNITTGNCVSLVLNKSDLKRALNLIKVEIFGHTKKINIAIFGHGLVGGTLIHQLLTSAEKIESKKGVKLNIFAVANSRKLIINQSGITENWKSEIVTKGAPYDVVDIINYAKQNHLENLIAVDNTASGEFVDNYVTLISSGFDVVSSNKIANTLSYGFYRKIRQVLECHQKSYLYETNVGAGLPLIDTIKLIHLSGDNITKIKGVFSGTLSYVFNHFSIEDKSFSDILKEAIVLGYTECDPREDLCGNDVARKLLILARELDLQNEFNEIDILNLIPEELRTLTTSNFLNRINLLDSHFKNIKDNQEKGHVLRYVGELSGDLQKDKGNLEVKLVSVPLNSALGQLKGSDSIFEIYTESYGDKPIVIQGTGAGASVTARGVFGDILRTVDKV